MIKLVSLLLTSVLLLGSCSAKVEKSNDAAQAPTRTITIAQFGHVFLYMPLYVAVRKGFFKEQGLDVKLISTGGDEKTFAAVAAGNAQFGVADPVFVAVARERGQGGKVVAGVVRGVPFWVVSFREDIKPFKDASGFSGFKVGTYTAPSTSYAVMKKVLQNDGRPVKAEIVEGAFGTLLPMMKANQADMAMTIEPMVSIAADQGARVVYSPADILGDFAFTGVTVSEKFHKEEPETIKKVVKALAKSMNFIHSDFEGALSVAKEEFAQTPPSVLKQALRRLIDQGTIPESPLLTEDAWKKAVELRKEIGDLKGPATFEENVDMTFAKSLSDNSDNKDSSTDKDPTSKEVK